MGVLVHLHDRFDPTKRTVHRLDRPVTVRRLVQRHKGLRKATRVYRPGGVYGRRRVREFTQPTVCLFNGKALTRKDWKRTTVGPSDVVAFFSPPTGGRGFMAIVGVLAAIAIAVVAPQIGAFIGPYIASGLSIGAATSVAIGTAVAGIALSALSYGVMSLFAQPAQSASGGTGFNNSTPASSPTYNLTAQGNYARLGSPIPEAFGKNRLFPDFVTTPYIRYVENEQFLHHIVGLGIGEYDIDEDSLKLGDTPISTYEDIEYAVIEPGALSDTDIADERWITATDLAQVELLDSAEGSPWAGPFAVNPPETTINRIEVDVLAPRGLWHTDAVSYIRSLGVDYEVEAQLIDDLGTAAGSWEALDSFHYDGTNQDPLRFTETMDLPSAGRWQVRLRRTDLKDTDLGAGHQLDWIGLRGRIIGRRAFPGMTCIAIKMKAGPALSSAQSRQFNLVATRKLETWTGSAMGTVKAATQNPCDAFAYIARTSNGGRLRDAQIDLAGLYAHYSDFDTNDWPFNFVFDNGVTVSEALARVARAVIAERVVQGGKLHLVRDEAATAPVAMFSPRNITAGSFSAQYVMPDSTAPDALIGTYIDERVWRPIDVTVAFDDSAQERPTRLTLHGVGNREQARAVLWNLARADRYRRKVYGWSTAMEGLAVTFGDGISFSHDVPSYGQTLEVIEVDDTDPNAPIFTVADLPDFSAGGTYYAVVRDSKGQKAGPFVAAPVEGEDDQVVLTVADPEDLPDILTGGDRERTWIQLGVGETYSKPLKIKQVTPRDETSADLIAYDDDPRMYAALPDEPEVPIGADIEALTVAITAGSNLNLRTLANTAGYSGLAVQQVTFTLAAGVEVTGLSRGSWPTGAVPILQHAGTITGANGSAGQAGVGGASLGGPGGNGGIGGTGGTALDSSSGALTITGAGTIRGGKGGGGGGGGGGGSYYTTEESSGEGTMTVPHYVAGGAGGAGNGGTGTAGTTDGPATSGNGGNGGALATTYGTAGTAGSAGTAASGGLVNGLGGAAGPGGPAGKAIVGVSNVDLDGFTGLIVGPTA